MRQEKRCTDQHSHSQNGSQQDARSKTEQTRHQGPDSIAQPHTNPYKKGDAPPFDLKPENVPGYMLLTIETLVRHEKELTSVAYGMKSFTPHVVNADAARQEIRICLQWLVAQGDVPWDGWW